jgi:signal transduction histidine kinase
MTSGEDMNNKIRLLYADDDPSDVDLTRTHFQLNAPEFEIDHVETGRECLARLKHAKYDAVLLDYRLPDMDGTDVLAEMAREEIELPVVMVTGVGDEELVVKALRLGAADYVPKQSDYLETLPGVLTGVIADHRNKRKRGQPTLPARLRILYLEYHEMDVDLTLHHFGVHAPHVTIQIARSCNEALERLSGEHDFDLVLTDLRMPDRSALEFLREARQRTTVPPFIVITGKGDEAAAIAALKLGAYDYIVKRDDYLTQLPYAIENAIARFRLDRANARLKDELALRERAEQVLLQSTERLQVLSRRLLEVQETERRHVALELHDEVGQLLTGLKINLELIRQAAGEDPLAGRLQDSLEIVAMAQERVRKLSAELRPSILDDFGLEAALRWLADRQAKAANFKARLATDLAGRRVGPDLETVCFRVVQEALTNVARHARAQHVDIELRAGAAELQLVVRDDGVGFDVATAQRRARAGESLGLLGMEERVLLAGGRIEINSGPSEGATVRAIFPLE